MGGRRGDRGGGEGYGRGCRLGLGCLDDCCFRFRGVGEG